MAKSLFSGPKRRNSPKSRRTSWQSDDYWSKDYFPSAYKFHTISTPLPKWFY